LFALDPKEQVGATYLGPRSMSEAAPILKSKAPGNLSKTNRAANLK